MTSAAPSLDFTQQDINTLLANLDSLTEDEINEVYKMAEELEERQFVAKCHDDLLEFTLHMMPDYIVGQHHRILSKKLSDIESGTIKRLCVNIAPRHGKSQLVSTMYPAWFLGRNPGAKVMLVSHTADLAVDFGRKVRDLIDSDLFQRVFPGVKLSKDNKSAGRWTTNAGGEFFACIQPDTPVPTPQGYRRADSVTVGDKVLTAQGFREVLAVMHTQHNQTVQINELCCTPNHPIATTRGWVNAEEVNTSDTLLVESIWDILLVKLRGVYHGTLEHPAVQALEKHVESLREALAPSVQKLRSAWHTCLRALAKLPQLRGRHGASAVPVAYVRQGRQCWAVLPGELQVGHAYRAKPQQADKQVDNPQRQDTNVICVGRGAWAECRSGSLEIEGADTTGRGVDIEKDQAQQSQDASEDVKFGWLRRAGVWFNKRSSLLHKPGKPENRWQGAMARVDRATQKLQGLLLGVRRVDSVDHTHHDTREFINYRVSDNNQYFANGVLTHNCGIGAKLAGRGADLLLIDDPHSEQDVLNGNFEVFEKAYNWFAYGARTRLMPGGRVAIVQCMTGDTPVLMADNTEKPLRDIKVGDEVATYDQDTLTTSKVLNHKSNGIDKVFTIKTTSRTVRANERHPFLVQKPNGERKWTRLKNLKVGDTLVSLKDAYAPEGLKPNQVNAEHASQKTVGIESTQMHRTFLWDITASIKAKLVRWLNVTNLPTLRGYALTTTTRKVGQRVSGSPQQTLTALDTSNIAMVSRWKNTIRCWLSKMASALFVNNLPLNTTPERIGMGSCVLTTATTPVMSERSCATIATSQLGTQRQEKQPSQWQNTSPFTLTKITSVEYTGDEEVFDVQIERTENFIANHIVSHNTRWAMDDLTGRLVKDMQMNPKTDQYEVIEFPAILEIHSNDGHVKEKALWPEFFDLEALKQIKEGMPTFQWNAQYQQNPTSEEAAVVKREWWQIWTKDNPPRCNYLIMSLDSAAETNNRSDFSALTTWGVFDNEETDRYELILLNSIKERYEFPELKDKAYQEYMEWDPDCFIVEKKSSGVALYQEMRRTGIPVQEFTPHRGTGDKLARLNSVADIIRSGMVHVPQTRWAEELVEEVAAFPFGSNDDLVDSMVMALMRFRNGGFIRLPSDEPEEPKYFRQRRGGYY